jgi:DNA-binding response OmpR family regulator
VDKTYDIISVEDDDDLVALLQLVLKDQPMRLRRASTGSEALRLLTEAKPDLLLLDISLPDMRGWDVLDKATEEHRLEGVPIVVLTSHSEAPHRVIGKIQEVAAYINKPVRPPELRETLRQILGIA